MLMRSPLAGKRLSPPGFIRPCQPTLATEVPTGSDWPHEVKYDGYRLIARKEGSHVRLWSRNGRNWTDGFRTIAAGLPARARGLSEHMEGPAGPVMFEHAARMGLEGIVSQRGIGGGPRHISITQSSSSASGRVPVSFRALH